MRSLACLDVQKTPSKPALHAFNLSRPTKPLIHCANGFWLAIIHCILYYAPLRRCRHAVSFSVMLCPAFLNSDLKTPLARLLRRHLIVIRPVRHVSHPRAIYQNPSTFKLTSGDSLPKHYCADQLHPSFFARSAYQHALSFQF